jgi:hypothetical protein
MVLGHARLAAPNHNAMPPYVPSSPPNFRRSWHVPLSPHFNTKRAKVNAKNGVTYTAITGGFCRVNDLLKTVHHFISLLSAISGISRGAPRHTLNMLV